MRLAKINRLIILAGVLAIVLAVVSWLQSGQEDVKQSMIPEMELAAKRVANLDLGALQQKIVELSLTEIQASANATAVKEHFAEQHQSLDVGETLYPIARECRVNLYDISSPGLAEIDLEGISGTELSLFLTVRGEVRDILDFINRVHEAYPLGQVSTVTINNNPKGIVRAASADNYLDGDIYEAAETRLQLVIQNYLVSDDSD